MKLLLGVVLAVAAAGQSTGETLRYEIRAFQADGASKVLHEGVRTYSFAKDIEVAGDQPHWLKSLDLAGGYRLAVDVYAKTPLDGFGLMIGERARRGAFSWNWFNRTDANVFTQLRGGGRVKVRTTGPSTLQVASIEFLDDITLGYTDDPEKHKPGESSHVVVIFKGSVLRVAP